MLAKECRGPGPVEQQLGGVQHEGHGVAALPVHQVAGVRTLYPHKSQN
jgi:hypothetical protein